MSTRSSLLRERFVESEIDTVVLVVGHFSAGVFFCLTFPRAAAMSEAHTWPCAGFALRGNLQLRKLASLTGAPIVRYKCKKNLSFSNNL